MGELVNFRKKRQEVNISLVWLENIFGVNPRTVKELVVLKPVDGTEESGIAIFFHKEDLKEDMLGWDLLIPYETVEEAEYAKKQLEREIRKCNMANP